MRKHPVRWTLLLLVCAAIAWVVASGNPFAQGIRALFGSKPDEPVMSGSFTLYPHGFRYYTFSLPPGSEHVALVGQFTATPQPAESGNRQSSGAESGQNSTSGIEVLVLSESEFARWQKGAATSSVYESGNLRQAKLQPNLPNGQGNYYLIFSNRLDPAAAKRVTASALVRHKSWFRR